MDKWQELKGCLLETREDDIESLRETNQAGSQNSFMAGYDKGRIDLINIILEDFFKENKK